MEWLDRFRDPDLARTVADKLAVEASRLKQPVTLMEVCGTHTMAIARYGVKSLIPPNVKLVSGPGCPVCVTPAGYVDTAIELCRRPNVIIATFGDMLKVPGQESSLMKERGLGRRVEVVASPLDALPLARKRPDKEIVFLGVGFETTAPSVAAAIVTAKREGIENFSVLASHKVMPEPMAALTVGELKIDGYICPAHVSAIIGEEGYRPLAETYHVPCVITGFEPLDVLDGVRMLVRQIVAGRATVENQYARVVRPEGNPKARALLAEVFEPCDAIWRGIGLIPGSGLKIRSTFAAYDAEIKLNAPVSMDDREHPACRCGEILKGLAEPRDCKLFGSGCTPDNPIGACMVSSEGSCAAEYRFGARERTAHA